MKLESEKSREETLHCLFVPKFLRKDHSSGTLPSILLLEKSIRVNSNKYFISGGSSPCIPSPPSAKETLSSFHLEDIYNIIEKETY